MSGHHTGGPNPEKWSLTGSGGNSLEPTHSQGDSGSLGRPYQERCVDPIEPPSVPMGTAHKADPRYANGKEAEIQDFLPVPEPSSGTYMCTPCVSVASCRTFVCSVVTCGLYRLCRRIPCLAPEESQSQEAKVPSSSAPSSPEKDESESGYTDIYFRGMKVDPIVLDDEPVFYRPPQQDLHKSGSVYLDGFEAVDEWSDGGGDVDSLISRKLLELYTQFQIDELANCTSDSVFLKRTSDISRLISDIVAEHKLEEQDAECRLVHGIIRLSTRKSKKRPPVRRAVTPADSGTETMKGSFSLTDSNSNDLDVQISKETASDVKARQMRHNSDRANSSSSPTTFSPAYRETDTESSGLPLLPLDRYPRT
ncbi:keratinocyte differentiation factor 1 [Clupea harengus]|uniref:Keratinocyte differentiation factor 1 n=1 Tax=Clupea harengus TaxID=7950 RepID=A0A6P8H541_CLUHA|nr:keratinocyte differentiation factor 1 [Clupea harengus]XP_031442405.1 keratinocyte differentiation factor 1 [Clupea harengus]